MSSNVRRGALSAVVLCWAAAFAPCQSTFAYYPDDNTGTSYAAPGGWFPWFTNATGTRLQMLVPATAFAPGTSFLTSIGFFLGGSTPANTPATFTIMQMRIGPAAVPALTNTFATNLVPGTETLVVDLPNSTYAANQNAWVDLPFLFPFPLPAGNLIVDMQTQIPSGGAYLASTVSSSVARCVAGTYTGQATGTLGASSAPKVRFGFLSQNILDAQTGGGGAGDLTLSLTNIDPAAVTGYLLISFDTTHAVGTGPALGIWPDYNTFSILFGTPLAVGNPLHFLRAPGFFPDVPFVVPPGSLSFLAGTSWDTVVLLLDATDVTYVGKSNVERIFW